MSASIPQSPLPSSPSAPGIEPLIPRRTLRKGTRSCIECEQPQYPYSTLSHLVATGKRRKIRCYVLSAREATCVGCQRRGTPCLGQEFFDEDAVREREDKDVPERLAKVESLLSRLMEVVSAGRLDSGGDTRMAHSSAAGSARHQSPAFGTPSSNFIRVATPIGQEMRSLFPMPTARRDLCRLLHRALPSQHDVDILFVTGRMSAYLRVLCNPYEEVFIDRDWLTDPSAAPLPGPDSHPILLARSLLQLTVCIQQLDPTFDASVLDMVEPLRQAMKRYFELATNLVMSNEAYLDSMEALESLALHAIVLTNGGHLRLALLHARRTITIAQLLGIHRPDAVLPQKLDQRTQLSCPVLWGRYVWLERYLSLLLGVPTATAGDTHNLRSDVMTATERLDMAHTAIFARITQRNQMEDHRNFTITQEIDRDIQQMASSFPPRWWTPPTIHPMMDPAEMLSCVVRGQSQMIHFNLVNVLHLPYILRDASDKKYDYHKTACMAAAREVLGRYVAFRSVVRVVFCCRLVDFCALTAAMSVLLAHLDSHENSIGDAVAGQRLEDRALVERALVTLDELNRVNDDELCRQTAQVARRLLLAESDAAAGGNLYAASSGAASDTGSGSGDGRSRRSFPVTIPYYRTVTVACETPESLQSDRHDPAVALEASFFGANTPLNFAFSPADRATSTSSPLAPTQRPPQELGSSLEGLAVDFWGGTGSGQTYPGLLTDANEWPFQGLDAVFFDTVLRNE